MFSRCPGPNRFCPPLFDTTKLFQFSPASTRRFCRKRTTEGTGKTSGMPSAEVAGTLGVGKKKHRKRHAAQAFCTCFGGKSLVECERWARRHACRPLGPVRHEYDQRNRRNSRFRGGFFMSASVGEGAACRFLRTGITCARPLGERDLCRSLGFSVSSEE